MRRRRCRGGQDLWIATDENGLLRFTVRWAFGGYAAETSAVTGIPTPSGEAWIPTADYDVDGAIDAFIVDGDTMTVWAMSPNNGSTSLLFSGPNPFPGADEYFLGDSDLDYRPDLWAVHDGRVATALASDGYRSTAVSRHPSDLPKNLVDVRAADYDGDGRVDLITFDGFTKKVWLGNTPLSDGLPPEVWFEYEDPQCEDGEQTWYRQELRFTTSTWIAHGAYSWRKQYGLPTGCDPSKPECDVGPVTRQMFSEFLAWVDGLQAPASVTRAAAWALDRAGYQIPCTTSAADCWSEAMPRAELSSLFGQFLSTRQGDVPPPHRWVHTVPASASNTHTPT